MQNNEFRDTIKRMQTLGLPCILDGVDYKLLTPQIIEYLQFRYFPRELLDRLPKDAVMAVIDWEAVRATENPCLRVHKGTHLIYSRPSEMEQSSFCESIILPEGLVAIGTSCFGQCGRLRSVELPNSLEYLGSSAFQTCLLLEHIELPDNLSTIPVLAFAYCFSLQSVKLPKHLREIGANAFSGCPVLPHLELPDGVRIWTSANPAEM